VITTILDLALVIVAFGLIIFFHELGHFLAARWAGIRVIAFALGFGPAAFSWRKGLGFRRGSSQREHDQLVATESAARISPTEYRLNFLPFGGYVKMLGQDDLDPTSVSSARDSYQSCKPWKRMIVISAGVVANLIIAAILFVVVFSVGLPAEPAKVGSIEPGSAASRAVATNAQILGVNDRGLLPGDRVLTIGDKSAVSFQDLILASAMARPGKPINLTVERAGVAQPLEFTILPETSPYSGMLEIGIGPLPSTRVITPRHAPDMLERWREATALVGLDGVMPGMRLASIGAADAQATGQSPGQSMGQPAGSFTPASTAHDIVRAIRAADGAQITLAFTDDADQRLHYATIHPRGQLEEADLDPDPKVLALYQHIAGLSPVMKVGAVPEGAPKHGLLPGDTFVRLGAVEYPSTARGILEIRAHKGREIPIIVERRDASGAVSHVSLAPRVDREGRIGFDVADTADESTRVALPPDRIRPLTGDGVDVLPPPAAGAILRPGTRIAAVSGEPVATFEELRWAIVRACRDAMARIAPAPETASASDAPIEISLTTIPPIGGGSIQETTVLRLTPTEAARIAALSWEPPFAIGAFFEMEQMTLKADGPLDAVRMGVSETHRWMMMTYATFARLFQGTVKVEHLKGPVGIAHLGTLVASQGTLKLLFFLGLVSVNLAVVNFLPLPIVDGGQFLFLLYEQIKGKPVPVAVQNITTLAGLALIGCMFLIVTFNDIRGLF
jgi:regulator of sigma E protease